MSDRDTPTIEIQCHGRRARAQGFEFDGQDLTGWGVYIRSEGTIFWGHVAAGDEGKVVVPLPADKLAVFQDDVFRGVLIGILPVGAEVTLANIVLNGLEQP